MKLAWKIFGSIALLLVTGILVTQMQGSAAAQTATPDQTVYSSAPVTPAVSRPVRDITPSKIPVLNREINPMLNPHRFSPDLGIPGSQTTGQDPLAALSQVETGFSPTPLFQFEGLGTDGFTPPDTMGEVGPNHYVQMVNVSFAIFDKSGNVLQADTPFTDLFIGSGLTACTNENDGDPVVVYDELADRWLLSQFAVTSGTRMCIAISQTADPTGAYWLYQFNMPDFPDYFKFGVWPDAYYMTTNTGFPNQYYAYAFDRAAMLTGAAATFQFSANHPNFMMPADLDGSTPPPAGSPGYFYTMLAEGYPDHPAGVDRLAFYEFDVDWATPGNTTFTMVDEIPIADYNYTVCGFFVGDCIPQPGTAQELDSLSYWPMWRFGYRNLGSYEALVGNFTVDVNGADRAAIRWFELRDSGSGWDLHQEGTHAPDSDHRWMGSIAMDGSGNIALGYSVSSGTTIPSIRYATRLASDPLGTLQAEENVITGGTQTGGASRWGDYSSMSVDPADDCTFWYTNEYHDVNASAFNWNTRIVVFRIPECSGALFPDFSLTADPTTYETCTTTPSVDYNITVSSIMSFTDQVDLSVLGNPAGTTTSFTVDPVTPPGSSVLTIGSLGSAVAGSYSIDIVGTAPTSTHTTTVGLDLYTAAPGTVTLTSPADGATSVGLAPTLTWTADANATDYYVEVATDMGFSNIVFTDTVVATSVNLSGLSTLTTYYWRVTPNNICGAGPSSAVFSFTTADGSLLCNVGAVDFEGGLPGDWLVTNDSPNNNAIVWGTTADAPATCGIANSTTGSGVAACADSDFPGSANSPAYDTSLVTNPFSTLPLSTVTLNVAGFYRDLGVGNDLFRVEVWDGSSWVTELSWDENHQTAGSGDITLDLSDYAGDSNTQVRFRYSGNGWDWYAQVDDVELTCVGGGTDLGYLTGTVTDSDTSSPISGADIMVDDGTTTYNLATDGSGVYTSSLPIGTYTITASATGYFSEMVSGITVATDATTVQDFDLGPAFVEIAVNPTEMEATVSVDGTADQTLTIWNMGTLDLDWTITEIAARANTAQATGGVPQRLQLFAPQPNPNYIPNLADIILDGGFEGGTPNASWTEASTNFGSPLCTVALCGTGTGTGPHSGLWWAWFGGASSAEEGSMAQAVVIPNGTATLSFHVEAIICASPTDFLEVTVDSTQVYLLDGTSPLCSQLGYTEQTVDLSAYADGNSHTIAFHSISGTGGSNFFVDDVVLDSTPGCVANDIPWLSINSTSGTTAAGGSTDVTITYDATGLPADVYTGTLCIESNDPINGEITVPVTMTVSEVGVDVGPNAALSGLPGETVTYTVAITNTGVNTDTYNLSLAGSTWITELSVTDITLMAGEMGSFDVTVEVPAGAWAGDWDAVTVMATSQADNGISDWAELTTTAEAVYGFDWSADTTGHTGEAGETVTYTISLTNTGNTTDTFNISLAGHSWTTTPSHNSMMLAPGESADFTVSVVIDAGAAHPDTDTTTLTVTSAGDGTVTDNVALTTSVEEPVVPANPVIYLPMIMKP